MSAAGIAGKGSPLCAATCAPMLPKLALGCHPARPSRLHGGSSILARSAGYLVTYAEFIVPICLLIGFATRFAALTLLAMTILLQIYVAPALWWLHHVYWICLLLILVARGPGAASIDALLRYLYDASRIA